MKKAQGGDHGNQYVAKDQNDTLANTAEVLSQQHGVSPATIKRDGQFASDVERLKTIPTIIGGEQGWFTGGLAI